MSRLFLLILGILFVLYGLFILGARSGTPFWLVWEALGGICFLAAALIQARFFERHRAIGITAGALAAAFLLLVGVLTVRIIGAFTANAPSGLEYLIVLGTQVREDGPSYLLKTRLDTAAAYLKANEHTVCIVSGGRGPNEPCAEADAMGAYLTANGIDESRILREDQSKNTTENIQFEGEMDIWTDPTDEDFGMDGNVLVGPDYTVEDDLTDDDTNTLGGQGLGDGTVSTGDT